VGFLIAFWAVLLGPAMAAASYQLYDNGSGIPAMAAAVATIDKASS